jgi:glutathione S-transferase
MSETIELYHYVDFDRSAKVRWVLCELDLPFEERQVDPEKRLEAPFADINPFSLVPAIRRGDEVIHDAGAIAMTLAAEHPESGLLPEDPRERAACQQWCWFSGSSFEGTVYALYDLRQVAPDSELTAKAAERLERFLDVLERTLSGRDSLLSTFTIADILLAYPLKGVGSSGGLADRKGLSDYLAALAERPASHKARFWAEPPAA